MKNLSNDEEYAWWGITQDMSLCDSPVTEIAYVAQ